MAIAPLATVLLAPATAQAASREFNDPGNVLIADQFNNRVIEVDRDHNIIWHFGNGSNVAGPHSVVGVNDAQRVGALTLIAGTGAPAGSEPGCGPPNGCPDNRVMLVNRHGDIVWQYGKAGVSGSGPDLLNVPVQSTWTPDGHVLITDQSNERVIEVDLDKRIVWHYGTGIIGSGPGQLNNPNSAELLANGDVLIADENNNRVIEVNRQGHIVWHYGSPKSPALNGAAFASRLADGDTLITDSLNNRIVEVNPEKEVVWIYRTDTRRGSVKNPNPTRAVRLSDGNTLISDQFNHQVIEVNTDREVVWAQGAVGKPGSGFNRLNAPYDAKVIGDYTGLTPPFGF